MSQRKIFLSCVNREFESFRREAELIIQQRRYIPVFEEVFDLDDQTALATLRTRISECDAVICFVGHAYGGEPCVVPDGHPRRSFTQWEYFFAKALNKPVYLLASHPDTPTDEQTAQPPREPESADRRKLQQEFRESVLVDWNYREFRNLDQLLLRVQQQRFKWEPGTGGRTAQDILQTGLEPLPETPSPARLLLAKHEVVAWDDDLRRQELDVLEQWTHASRGLSVRLFTGPGGSGKTRLFVEWCKRLRDKDWDAGLLPNSLIDQDCTGVVDVETLVTNDRPTLIVIDYAESCGYLTQFLKQACDLRAYRTDLPPLRIALLAREEADWYRSLVRVSDDLRDLLEANFPQRLREVALEGELRKRALRKAVEDIAKQRRKPPPLTEGVSLADSRFNRVLYIHMAALGLVEGLEFTAEKLLSQILDHETRFWSRPFVAKGWNNLEIEAFESAARRWVAALTLLGGAPDKSEAERLRNASDGPNEPSFLTQLLRLYPGTKRIGEKNQYLSGLEPDILGEQLIYDVISQMSDSGIFLAKVTSIVDLSQLANAFLVLGRIAWRRTSYYRCYQWIWSIINVDFSKRQPLAVRALVTVKHDSGMAFEAHMILKPLMGTATLGYSDQQSEIPAYKESTPPSERDSDPSFPTLKMIEALAEESMALIDAGNDEKAKVALFEMVSLLRDDKN
jgi:hypothetical protein